MLHRLIRRELLADEVATARERLGDRVDRLVVEGDDVHCAFVRGDGWRVHLRLAGAHYDARPFEVAAFGEDGRVLGVDAWPPGLPHGRHPVLDRPFVCIQGTYEYHTHPSHFEDVWDRYRHRLRLADLLDHLLRKCGR